VADVANYNAKVYPYSAYDLVQLGDNVNAAAQTETAKRWVELPDCTGATDEVALVVDHTWEAVEGALTRPNGTVATCKHRPGADESGEASEALDSVTPGF